MDFMPYIWLLVIVAAIVVEASTSQLVSIWFVVGGIAALITSLFSDSLLLQIIMFVSVTLVTLLATRPLVKRILHFKKEDTNAGRYIGRIGLVTVAIDNEHATGQVSVEGSVWSARSIDGTALPIGKEVVVQAIEGVKLLVKPVKKEEENR